jgi:hypothetical protein
VQVSLISSSIGCRRNRYTRTKQHVTGYIVALMYGVGIALLGKVLARS